MDMNIGQVEVYQGPIARSSSKVNLIGQGLRPACENITLGHEWVSWMELQEKKLHSNKFLL